MSMSGSVETDAEMAAAEMGERRNLLAPALPASCRSLCWETDKDRWETMRNLQKEAFQLANYYFVFQGVIFTGFYSFPSEIKCRYRLIPFLLSFLAGFINLTALSSMAFKYKNALDEIDRTALHTPDAANSDETVPPLTTAAQKACNPAPGVVACESKWRMFYVICCLILFVAFLGVTLAGCWLIPCGKSSVKAPPSPTAT